MKLLSRLATVVVFLCVLALVVWAVLLELPASRPGGRHVVQLDPGESMAFSVLPETYEVVLVTSALALPSAPPDARQAMDVPIDVAWISPAGEVRREERLWERTRVSTWPLRDGSWRSSAILRDDGSWATDTRTTVLPVGGLLPAGGELRIAAPLDGSTLLLRAYGGREQEVAVSDRKSEERARIARRVGVGELSMLEPDERGLALGRPRRSLAYRMLSGDPPRLRRLVRTDAPLPLTDQPTAGSFLEPGQAIAVHLDGPVSVRLSVPDGLDELFLDARVDLPEGLSQPALTVVPAPPLPLAGGAEGARVELEAPNTTLLVHNRSDRLLGPVLLGVQGRSTAVLAAETPAVALQRLAPWSDEDITLVGPDRVTVPAIEIGPGRPEPFEVAVPLGQPAVRLTVRPVVDGLDDRRRHPVRVSYLDAQDNLLDVLDLAVPSIPAPLERRADDGGWLGESIAFELQVPDRTSRLQVTSGEHPVRVSAHVEGPPRGRPDPTVYSEWFLRYWRNSLSPWHLLPPLNAAALREAHQVRPILANVRLERWEPDPDAETRRYAILDPVPGAEGLERTWLLPGPYPDGRAWCRQSAGEARAAPWDASAISLRDGELHAILHTPSARALGAPWRLEVDGLIVASGRLTQRIEPLRLVGLPAAGRFRLVGPAGLKVWLRARGDAPGCDDPHRGVSAWPMEPGTTMSFSVQATGPGHRLYLSGFADRPVTIDVTLTGLAPTPEDEDAGTWTERVRLAPGEGLAQRLRDPDSRLPSLQPVGFQLGGAAKTVGLEVTQVEGPEAWLRILTEIDAQADAPVRRARLIRRGP